MANMMLAATQYASQQICQILCHSANADASAEVVQMQLCGSYVFLLLCCKIRHSVKMYGEKRAVAVAYK